MDFETEVRLGTSCVFKPPLFNGAGCCKTVENVLEFAKSSMGAVVVGSFTMESRSPANPADPCSVAYPWLVDGSIFWSGLNNPGAAYLQNFLPDMLRIAHIHNKPLVVSVAGRTPEEYGQLAKMALSGGADAVELCMDYANTHGTFGTDNPTATYDVPFFSKILWKVKDHVKGVDGDATIWVKVAPTLEAGRIQRLAEVVLNVGCVSAVTAVNAMLNSFLPEHVGILLEGYPERNLSGKVAQISPEQKDRGYYLSGGSVFRSIALSQAKQWVRALSKSGSRRKISVIASGGIASPQDIQLYADVGCRAFQVTTALYSRGSLDLGVIENICVGDANRMPV